MKINKAITIDVEIAKQAKKRKLNVSAICEDALRMKLSEPSKEDKERQEREAEIVLTAQKEAVEREKVAREAEAECVVIDRNLWNKTYLLFKETYGDKAALDLNTRTDRIEKRVSMFKQLLDLQKQQEDEETKELLK